MMLQIQYKSLIISAFFLCFSFGKNTAHAQALPIAIDGQYDDWSDAAISLEDAAGGVSGVDFLKMTVANDEQYLFIRLEIGDDVVLTNNNGIVLYIDGDKNNLTGKAINGIGAELELQLGNREGKFYHGNTNWTIYLEDVAFHNLPNYSSTVFEMAIGRDVLPDGNNPLFEGNDIRLFFQNGSSGDKMPNQGDTFNYSFDDTPTPPYQAVDLQKTNTAHLRLMTWNTLFDGLLDNDRKPHFQRVLVALQPDVVTFNECWDMTAGQAATFMNSAIPLGNFQSWKSAKLEDGNITVSRYPITQSWNIYPGHRLFASLIDLPDASYAKDILVINGHLRCCEANAERQQEADAFAEFILDATSTGGLLDLPEGTPFVLSGDMNLVGDGQQYTTLVTGDIVNTNSFGNGAPLDWDGTDLLDVVALQADIRMAYTWYESGSQYPPSRLDYHFCSNSVLNIEKAFSLQTPTMSAERLDAYDLELFDTELASDHLPKVTDFSLKATTATTVLNSPDLKIAISPNPATAFAQLKWSNPKADKVVFSLKSTDGRILKQWATWHPAGYCLEQLDLAGLASGAYWLELRMDGAIGTSKVIVVEK